MLRTRNLLSAARARGPHFPFSSLRDLALLALLGLASVTAFGATVVVPNNAATVSGNASNNFVLANGLSVEYQELLGSGQMPNGPIQITQLSLRAAPGSGPINATIGNFQVYLSTSPNYPNTSGAGKNLMSSTYASNVGPDKTLVFSGPATVSSPGCASPGPCPFDLNIVFTTPFNYDNANGPLLIDFLESSVSVKSGAFDSASFGPPGGAVAQVGGPLGDATGLFSYQGQIVQLTYIQQLSGVTFSGVVNPAGGITPGFPGYGFAQGSIFTAYGNNLGPATAAQATTLPLPTTGLGGTTATLSVRGANPIPIPLLYTSNGQINGMIPSNAPLGLDTLTVTFNGSTSSVQVPVVSSNFGIVQYGSSRAVVTFADYSLVTATNTAKPGDTLILWGTGLGALPPDQTDAAGAAGGNLPAPIRVFVGGVLADIAYQGRTPGSTGLDQINFVVPPTSPLGCTVSVVVQTGTGSNATVSNSPAIALASTDGAVCSDPSQKLPQALIPGLLSKSTPTKLLFVNLQQETSFSSGTPSPTTSASEQVIFGAYSPASLANVVPTANSSTAPSLNTCLTQIADTTSNSSENLPDTFLDAGASVTLKPAQGTPTILSSTSKGVYAANVSSIPSGAYQFSNSGGADVPQLSFSFPVPKVTWTNQNQIATTPTNRANGLTVTWSGGDSTGYVIVYGKGASSSTGKYEMQFACSAPAAAGSLTVPGSILLALPPSGPGASAVMGLITQPFPGSLGTVPGFDLTLNLTSYKVSGVGLNLQ